MYIKLNTKFRKVVAISPNELVASTNTKVFNKPDITTTNIKYIKITGFGENIDVSEMTDEEKAEVDNIENAKREAAFNAAKETRINSLNRIFQEVSDRIAKYPANEIASWNIQLAEAKAYQADNTAPTPMIDLIASHRDDLGSTVEEKRQNLVNRILNHDVQWTTIIGNLIGLRHKKELEIQNATSFSDFEDINDIRREFYSLFRDVKNSLESQ